MCSTLAAPASGPASITSLLKTPTAGNLIRVFRLQERLKSLGKDGEFKAAHVHVIAAELAAAGVVSRRGSPLHFTAVADLLSRAA